MLLLHSEHGNQSAENLSFDPVDSSLFWVDTTHSSINRIQMKAEMSNSTENPGTEMIHSLSQDFPRGLITDPCTRYAFLFQNLDTIQDRFKFFFFFFKVALKLFILFFQTFQTIDLFLLVNLFTYVIDSLLYSLYCLYFCHNCVKLLNAILILELFVLSINLFQIE